MTTTTDQFSGRAIGALFFALFGAAWLSLWLAGTGRLTAVTGSSVALGALVLLLTSAWVLRRVKQLPTTPPSSEEVAQRQRRSRVFGWVNAAQWGSIFVLSWLLNRLGYGLYVTSLTAAIVGLHFFPLAHLFRYPVHYLTGAALLIWTLGCVLLSSQPALQAQTAIGAGLILWGSASYALWRAVQGVRQYRA